MRKMLIIAVREYLAAVRTKAFIISVVFLPLLMGTSIGIQVYLKKMDEKRERQYAVVDRTPGHKVLRALQKAVNERHASKVWPLGSKEQMAPGFTLSEIQPKDDVDAQRYELSEQVREGKIDGFVEVGAEIFQTVEGPAPDVGEVPEEVLQAAEKLQDRFIVRFQSKNAATPSAAAADPFMPLVIAAINKLVRDERSRQAKLPAQRIEAIARPVPVVPTGLTERDPKSGLIEEATTASLMAPFLVPAALLTIMFLMIMVGATPLMQGVLEEKTQRIAEVLLGSVQPFTLMMGKLLGTVGVSMTMAAVYLTAGYWAADYYGYAKYVPMNVLAWFVAFQALAVLMYGSVFIAIGAACTDMRETQTLMWPVVLVACIPTFMLSSVIQDPNGSFVTATSFLPPATPMLMIARQSVPPGISWWQPAVGAVGVLLATLLCVYAAGRIFRVGLLMQGKGARVSEMVKWVFRG